MIDVPVLVKDALRDGRRLKNYRIDVYLRGEPHVNYLMAHIPADDNVYHFSLGYFDASLFFTSTVNNAFDYFIYDDGEISILVTGTWYPSVDDPNTYQFLSGQSFDIANMSQITLINLRADVDMYNYSSADGDYQKAYTLNNDELVSESFKFDERMDSADTVTFGLCEGTSLEFQYFNHPNMNGARLMTYIDIQYEDSDKALKWYTIPMGIYDVAQCSTQASTGIKKVLAYNSIKQGLLDEDASWRYSNAYQRLVQDYSSTFETITLDALTFWILENLDDNNFNYGFGNYIDLTWEAVNSSTTPNVFTKKEYDSSGVATGNYLHLIRPTVLLNFDHHFTALECYGFYTTNVPFYKLLLDDELDYLDSYVKNSANTLMTFKRNCLLSTDSPFRDSNVAIADFAGVRSVNLFGAGLIKIGQNIETISGSNTYISVRIPSLCIRDQYSDATGITADMYAQAQAKALEIIDGAKIGLRYYIPTKLGTAATPTQQEVDDWSNFTLRQMLEALYEPECMYARVNRKTGNIKGMALNNDSLYPAEDLYPDDGLYPAGDSESPHKSQYIKLWYELENIKKYKNIVASYKTADGSASMTMAVNANGNIDYDMTKNWILNNVILTEQQVAYTLYDMAKHLKTIEWFPFEMWAAGLPYIETGDMIEINVGEESHTSYVLQRQLTGIQNLQDTYINGTLDIF